MRILFIFLIVTFIGSPLFSQDSNLSGFFGQEIPDDSLNTDLAIFGTIKDYNSRMKIPGGKITISIADSTVKSVTTNSQGRYNFSLPLDQQYKLEFSMPGYVSKSIQIESRNIPLDSALYGFAIGPLDASLFKEVDGLNFSFLQEEIAGKFSYNDEHGAIEWDYETGNSAAAKISEKFEKFRNENREDINILLDQWHKAAAEADEKTYFGSMTEDAIFLGTDKTERWEKKIFEEWAQPHFEKDKAWAFTSRDRVIYIHDDFRIAWFEELLDTWMGTCRGSGVLERTSVGWKIKHYNLALLVDNDKMDKVIEVTK